MTTLDVLIIGAGAAGLMAARELAKAGKKVIILEARDRIGGRIHTLEAAGFSVPVETGAEFIHGDLPLTLQLLKEAGISHRAIGGETWRVEQGERQGEPASDDWSALIANLEKLDRDVPIAAFLDQHFGDDRYTSLRNSVRRYAEGYDAADPGRASALALLEEWTSDDDNQYRLPGGYGKLMDFLREESGAAGCRLRLSTVAEEIRWQPGRVEVVTNGRQRYVARRALVTVPLGVLQSETGSRGHLGFTPALPQKRAAAQAIGFGAAIKILLEFKVAFWEDGAFQEPQVRPMPGLGFLLSDAPVPTWWTQWPERTAVLTGWLAGPGAEKLRNTDENELLEKALDSLASLFCVRKAVLRDALRIGKVINWTADPFARGAYAYATVEAKEARKVLSQPVHDTLFFAGEALYEGPAGGTVEAALVSGRDAAKAISSGERGPSTE
ncbi:MAG: FAD-dependent oxidoreductase [Ferruginibacter sp.]|nr:FAD-dependent oxidoreductase [Cytophagales bacterium]